MFTGTLTRNEVADAFASADVFIFPSRTDTAANVVLEAQASGLPVLVTDEGGPRENMVDGETGQVIVDRDAASWAAALTPLLRYAESGGDRTAGAWLRESRSWASALEPLFRTYRDLAGVSARSSTVPDWSRGAPRRDPRAPTTVAGCSRGSGATWRLCGGTELEAGPAQRGAPVYERVRPRPAEVGGLGHGCVMRGR